MHALPASTAVPETVTRSLFVASHLRRMTLDHRSLESTLAAPARRRLLAEPHQGSVAQVERIPAVEVTSERMVELALRHRPTVLAGGCAGFPATRWSLDEMDRLFGHYPCSLRSPNEANRPGRARDMLELLRARKASGQYLDNASDIPAKVPGLLKDAGLGVVRDWLPPAWPYLASQVFLGGPDTLTNFHCADNTSIFLQLQGRKHWTFVHGGESARMYSYPSTSGVYRHSPVDPQDPEVMGRYPLYEGATRLETTLEPGDILLLPRWWWHEVRNEGELNFGISTRWGAPAHDLMRDQNLPYLISDTLFPPPSLTFVAAEGGSAISDSNFRATFYEGLMDQLTITTDGRRHLPDFRLDAAATDIDVDAVAAELGESPAGGQLLQHLACLVDWEAQQPGSSSFADIPFTRTARYLSRWQPRETGEPRALLETFLRL